MEEKVLFVDDDPGLLAALRRSLRKEAFEFIAASSGAEALEILQQEAVAVVVSDNDMPGMKGTAFLQAVHEQYPDTIRFMLTGQATLEVAIEAINAGAITRFFTKPCNSEDLAWTIRQALEHRRLLRASRRLLEKVERQDAMLGELEERHPGITDVQREPGGIIVIEESAPGTLDDLLCEIETHFGQSDAAA